MSEVCDKHGLRLQLVCGDLVCGSCYEEWLLAQPQERMRQRVQVEERWVPDKHRMVPLRKRGPREERKT